MQWNMHFVRLEIPALGKMRGNYFSKAAIEKNVLALDAKHFIVNLTFHAKNYNLPKRKLE